MLNKVHSLEGSGIYLIYGNIFHTSDGVAESFSTLKLNGSATTYSEENHFTIACIGKVH